MRSALEGLQMYNYTNECEVSNDTLLVFCGMMCKIVIMGRKYAGKVARVSDN
jgi:hypothetical protein